MGIQEYSLNNYTHLAIDKSDVVSIHLKPLVKDCFKDAGWKSCCRFLYDWQKTLFIKTGGAHGRLIRLFQLTEAIALCVQSTSTDAEAQNLFKRVCAKLRLLNEKQASPIGKFYLEVLDYEIYTELSKQDKDLHEKQLAHQRAKRAYEETRRRLEEQERYTLSDQEIQKIKEDVYKTPEYKKVMGLIRTETAQNDENKIGV